MRKQNKKINWTAHLIELFVVFIGISLAFTLDNWRESSKTRNLEEQYLMSFASDLSDDASNLQSILNNNRKKETRAKNFISHLKAKNAHPDSALLILSDIMAKSPFSPKLTTYESIKSSGNLNIITNYELRQEIIGYYQKLIDKNMKEDVYDTYINTFAIPYVYNNLNFLNQKLRNISIVRDIKFHNLILGYFALLTQNIQTYQIINENNSRLQEHISKVLTD
jgi:hypothetical protein